MSQYYYFIKNTLASFDENISRSVLVLTEGSQRTRMQLYFHLLDLITLQTSKADSTLFAGIRRGARLRWRCKHGQLFRSVLRDRACIAVTVHNSMLKFVL